MKRGWSVNVNGGVSLFYGDVEIYDYYKVFSNNSEWRLGGGIMVQKELNPYITLRGQGFYGQLSGTKRKANIWFEGDLIELSLSGKVDLITLFWGEKDRLFTFYGMLGLGLAQWKTQLKNLNNNKEIGGNGNYGSGINGRTLEAVLPFGLGVDVNINERWAINLEGSLRPVNSDKLDGKEGGFQFDLYSYDFIGVTYKFVKREARAPELPFGEPVIVKTEPEVEQEVKIEEVVVEEPPRQQTLDDKLLDKEARTGMYESPWPGVEFTVQVAASKSINNPEVIREKFGLSGVVEMNQGEGWYRFSVGKFIKYWKAKEYRNILATRNNIKDAFVVAYKDGKRIMLHDLVNMGEPLERSQPAPEERALYSKSFSVQIMASKDGNIPAAVIREMYEIDLEVYKEFNTTDKTYQYTVGSFSSYADAAKVRNKLRARGIREAFVIGYKDGIRVDDLSTILE